VGGGEWGGGGGGGGSGYIISTSTGYLASSPEFPPAKIPVMQTTLVCVLCKSNKICIAMGRKILLTIACNREGGACTKQLR